MANKSKDVKNRPAGKGDKFEIDRPAGKGDKFEIVGLDIKNIIELGKDKLKVDNGVRVSNLSIELTQGMTIKAYDGGREVETER